MQIKTMYRSVADFDVLEGVALYLARVALNTSRLVASVVGSTGVLFMDKRSYCRQLMALITSSLHGH